MSDFGIVVHPVGRKEHRCEWCYGPIPKGEKHARFVGKWQGEFQDWRMHNECLDASEEYRDDGFEAGSGDAPARIWELMNARAEQANVIPASSSPEKGSAEKVR